MNTENQLGLGDRVVLGLALATTKVGEILHSNETSAERKRRVGRPLS